MQQRLLLAVVAVCGLALLAGCSSPGSLSLSPATDAAVADAASEPVEAVARPSPVENRSGETVVRRAITNGSATVTAPSSPVETGQPVAVDGVYYNLTATVVAREPAVRVGIEIDYNTTAAAEPAIAYEALPPVDRAVLGPLVPPRDAADEPGMDRGLGATYTDSEANASVLVPTQEYAAVGYDGERYPITVGEPRQVSVATYRITATQVASNRTAFADRIRERYAFAPSGLTADQRGIFEAAVDGEYRAESSDNAAFEELVAAFRRQPALETDGASGTWLVRYAGESWLAELRYYGFADDESQAEPPEEPPAEPPEEPPAEPPEEPPATADEG